MYAAMFFYSVCLLITVFCCTSVCVLSDSGPEDHHTKKRVNFRAPVPIVATPFARDDVRSNLLWHHLLDGGHPENRNRRGIVLVDEDFDVPPKMGVKLGWSDGVSNTKDTELGTKDDNVEFTEEGSGEELIEFSTINYSDMTSPDEFKKTTKGAWSTHSPDITSSGELERTTKGVKLTPITDVTDIEGSGGDISELTSSTVRIPTEPPTPSTPTVCLNITCDSQVIVLSGYAGKVPVGTNLSLTCVQVNSTESGLLQWYKYNESGNSHLQAHHQDKGLTFNILKSQMQHSGTYMCVHSSGESCCHRQLDVTIYEVPNYKTHIIIIAVVAAVSLFTCLLLSIYRNFRVKKYEVPVELQNMETPFMYKA